MVVHLTHGPNISEESFIKVSPKKREYAIYEDAIDLSLFSRDRSWGSCASPPRGLEAKRGVGHQHRLRVLLLLELLPVSQRHCAFQDWRPRDVHCGARDQTTRPVGGRTAEEEKS